MYNIRTKDEVLVKGYKIAYKELVEITKNFGVFPTVKGWTKYAKEKRINGMFSNTVY